MGLRCAAFLVCLLAASPAVFAELSVRVEQDHVLVVSGLTPGGEVVVAGAGRYRSAWQIEHLRVLEVRVDDDGDGSVTVELDQAIPLQSVWWAVDATTGDLAVATREGYTADRREAPAGALARGDRGEALLVVHGWPAANALVVRPGAGVWTVRAGDGALNDSDGAPNGVIQIPVAAFRPRAGTAAPDLDELLPGDVLVVVSPRRLAFYATRVAAEGR